MVAQPQPSQQVRRPRPRCGSSVRSYKPASARVAAGRCADLRNDTAKRCYVACRGSAASAALEFGGGTRTPRLSGICAPTSLASRGPGRILVPGLVCTRFGGRVPRADRRSSVNWPGLLMGAPRPQQEIPAGGCRLPPAQRAISELMKRATSVISRLSFHPLTASSGERDRPGLIAAIAQLGRRVPATRARPSERSPADRQVTAQPPWSRSRAVLTDHRPERDATAHRYRKRCAEIRLCGAWHKAPAVGRRCCRTTPHAAIGRRERALCSALMPGRPSRGPAQPNLNPSDTTPIPAE